MGFIDAVSKYLERFDPPIADDDVHRQYTEHLLRWATKRDERSRDFLVGVMAQHDFAEASRIWVLYLIFLFPIAFFSLPFGLRGCGFVLLLAVLIPILHRVDQWRRRRAARRCLGEGEPIVHHKIRVGDPKPGSRIFQSYWKRATGEPGELELDHPAELRDAVEQSDTWWQWNMPVPSRTGNGKLEWIQPFFDIGLAKREPGGDYTLIAGGVVYFPYDPWADRIETDGYE